MTTARTLFGGALLLTLALAACSDEDDTDTDSDSNTDTDTDTDTDSDTDTDAPISVPDPGDGAADWFAQGDHSTPETSWPVGIVTGQPGYIEGTAGDDGSAFYVFEAGASIDITIALYGGQDPNFVHLHEADGLVFGDELDPISTNAQGGIWAIEQGKLYVMEANFPGAGFF